MFTVLTETEWMVLDVDGTSCFGQQKISLFYSSDLRAFLSAENSRGHCALYSADSEYVTNTSRKEHTIKSLHKH